MNIKKIVIFFILLGALTYCSKKDKNPSPIPVYKTVEPLDYFPAYPGSYWIYSNGDTLKVADSYEKYIYNKMDYTSLPQYDTLMLPKLILNGIYNSGNSYAFVNGYSISKPIIGADYRDPSFESILSTGMGSTFIITGVIQNHQTQGQTIKTDTTVTIGNTLYENVLITIQYDIACGGPAKCATLKEYYAKNVGLIKREKRDNILDSVFVSDIELVKYEIKK